MSKSILQIISSCSVQKPLQKTLNIREMRAFGKSAIMHAKAIAHAKSSLWLKNSNSKKHVKIHSTNHFELFCAKTAPKNTKYSRNESILEIGHHAYKGYTRCKILTLVKKLKLQKTCQNPFYKSFRVVLCKKTLQKTLNIREMRAF